MSESRAAQFARIQTAYGPAPGRVVRSYGDSRADQEDLAQDIALAVLAFTFVMPRFALRRLETRRALLAQWRGELAAG